GTTKQCNIPCLCQRMEVGVGSSPGLRSCGRRLSVTCGRLVAPICITNFGNRALGSYKREGVDMSARSRMLDMRRLGAALMVAGTWPCAAAYAQQAPKTGGPTQAPAGAAVYFLDLKDSQTIPANTVVHFGLTNMGVAPAGTDRPNSGHHHLL